MPFLGRRGPFRDAHFRKNRNAHFRNWQLLGMKRRRVELAVVKSRNPEIPKPLFSMPLTFVLDVILVDLEPLFTKSDQNLVPDRDASFRVAEA